MLFENLGALSHPITTRHPLAQQFFDQGLRLCYAFNHAEALRAFRKAQQIDPECAMCYWGEVYALGPNINAPMATSAMAPSSAALERAKALSSNASPHEQALIVAIAERYTAGTYADAMTQVMQRFPEDNDVRVLFAESIMMMSPWDYWQAGGTQAKGRMDEAVLALEQVLKSNPSHPGAIHFYIHAVEASIDPKRAEPYADRLGNLMPGAGHLVHMPSHIYYRVGRYRDALEVNRRAVAVDEAYFAKVKSEGIYPAAHYPHNVHFLMAAAQMAGDGVTVVSSAGKIDSIITAETVLDMPGVQPMKAAQYFAHAQFSSPDTILALPDPGDSLSYLKAMWHYARGIARAAQRDLEGAQTEAAAIGGLLANGYFSALTNEGVPAPDILRIAQHVVQARIAQARADLPVATAQLREAAALQDKLPYMEPPYWYYPVRQSLGAVLLQAGDLDGAEQAFRESLARAPNNGWSLYGLRQVYEKRGDQRAVHDTEELLGKAWVGSRELLELARL